MKEIEILTEKAAQFCWNVLESVGTCWNGLPLSNSVGTQSNSKKWIWS
jgi:hypothetical protein